MIAPRDLLNRMFAAAVERALPAHVVPAFLPEKPPGRCVVVGAGKASAAMAAAVDAAWPEVDLSGVVVTADGHGEAAGRIRVIEARHPVPDQRSRDAAATMLAAVSGLGPDDMVLALISGGGSSLMVAPAPPMTLADKQEVNRLLLASGAPIEEMNVVRKHLSTVKGGRLALAAAPARVVTLLISDVPGDAPESIASGPTVGDPGSLDDVRAILARRGIVLPDRAATALAAAVETPAPSEMTADVRIVASPSLSLAAAVGVAEAAGVRALVLGDAIEGEARHVATAFAGIARSVRTHALPVPPPVAILSGGETTVTIGARGAGRGGRNTEFQLALAIALAGAPGIWALACDTDGIDGTEDSAGAIVTPETLSRAASLALDPRKHLQAHDSYSMFAALGDLVRTGPTRTNVNDFRAMLVL